MYQVMFIGKVKDLNKEYEEYSDTLYDTAKGLSGFIALESEVIEGVEMSGINLIIFHNAFSTPALGSTQSLYYR